MKPHSILSDAILSHIRRRKAGQSLQVAFDRTRQIDATDVLLVCCLRNEMRRMRFFCEYYRALGVDHFLFIDNGSTDGFQSWAVEHEDISVWSTVASYKDANFGMEWCNYLLDSYGADHLCVTVDPDEFLVYPFCETRTLADLGQHLRDSRKETLTTLMLDMYGDGHLEETSLEDGQDPLAVCPYFDQDGYIQHKSYLQGFFVRGGPRMRVHNADRPALSPALNKVPVVWWKAGYRYESSMHGLSPHRLNRPNSKRSLSTTGCLLHFKFVASLAAKIDEEKNRRQHYGDGREYERYGEAYDRRLHHPGISTRYKGPNQLIELGLMSQGDWF